MRPLESWSESQQGTKESPKLSLSIKSGASFRMICVAATRLIVQNESVYLSKNSVKKLNMNSFLTGSPLARILEALDGIFQ